MLRVVHKRLAAATFLFFIAGVAYADCEQPWSGSIGLGAAGNSINGSQTSFRSQTGLRSGFLLDELTLNRCQFNLRASGFGNAEPSSRATAEWRLQPLKLALSYDRRRSFFALADSPLDIQRDDWRIERWSLRATWDGWASGRFIADLHHDKRSGQQTRSLFGLNEQYPLLVHVNDSVNEAVIRYETRSSPVAFTFEHGFARYERRDRTAPASPSAIGVTDPDLFVGAPSDRLDTQNVPTSRLTAAYDDERIGFAANGLYSPSRLRSRGPVTTAFDVGGGTVGRIDFIDSAAASASRDLRAGNLRFLWRVAPRWSVRLTTDFRDASTDATLLGEQLINILNPNGAQNSIGTTVDQRTLFDFTDTNARLELERGGEHFTVRAGATATRRDVEWTTIKTKRTSNGETFSAIWRSPKFFANADFEHGTFEHYVFRTDPETIDRFRFRAGLPLTASWRLQGEGRFERGQNGQAISALDHRSNSGVLDLSWLAKERDATAGFNVSTTSLHTRTNLVLPNGESDLSRYDLSLLTLSAHGHAVLAKSSVDGFISRMRDNGATRPLVATNAHLRATFPGPKRLSFGVFADYWSYDERAAQTSDFDVTRYGVLLLWRFQ